MSTFWVVVGREVLTRVRTKAFIITTALLLLGGVAVALLSNRMLGESDDVREAAVGLRDSGVEYKEALETGTKGISIETRIVDGSNVDLEDGEVDVIFDGEQLLWDATPSRSLDVYVRSVVQQGAVSSRAESLGVSSGELAQLFIPVEVGESLLNGDSDEQALRMGIAAIIPIAMFFLLQVSGQFVMMGVVEEKTSRVVEVVLGRVRPRTLLAGKIVGLGALVLFQALIIVSCLLLVLFFTSDVSISAETWSVIPLFLPILFMGYLFYSTAFAAAASLVSRQEDLQGVVWPIMIPLLAGYILAVSSVGEPGNVAITIASYIPFTSPVVLPFRVASGVISWWEIVICLAISGLSAFAMMNLASRVYQGALLRVGKRISWVDAWKNRSKEAV